MKKTFALITIALLTLTGCTTTSTSTSTAGDKAYIAGCGTAVLWSATEDYLPDEVTVACRVAYNVLNTVYGTNTTADITELATVAIAEQLGEDATASETALATMLFNIANAKLAPLITEEADKLVLLKSFAEGLNATLTVSVAE